MMRTLYLMARTAVAALADGALAETPAEPVTLDESTVLL